MQDEQCTHNLTLRRVHVSIFTLEKQYVLNVVSEWVYSCLIYLALKTQAAHYVFIVRLYNIFPKNIIEHVPCIEFLYNFAWNVSPSKENSATYYHKCT